YQPPGLAMGWLIRLLILGAMAVSGLLLAWSLSGATLPGCGPGSAFDCGSVLASRWSKWFGLPVSALAMAMYLAMLILVQWAQDASSLRCRRLAWLALVTASLGVLWSVAWFVGLQVTMQQYCLYCMIAH